MRLFKIPNGLVDNQTRAVLLTPPFDLDLSPERQPPVAGYRSLLAPWLGGAGQPPLIGAPGTAGFYSHFGFWVGGFGLLTEDPPEVTDASGREGIGVVQPLSGTQYPFVEPSVEIQHLLADFHLSFRDPADYDTTLEPFRPPFQIAWIYGLGDVPWPAPDYAPAPIHAVDLLVRDADDRVVFDSTLADNAEDPGGYYTTKPWGSRFQIYEWRTSTAVCRAVVFTRWPEIGEPVQRSYYDNIVPTNGVLDARAVIRDPKHVTSLQILLLNLTKSFRMSGGYNVELTDLGDVSVPGGRRQRQIEIAAVPGSGRGQFPSCTPEDVVMRSINGSRPNAAGGFLLLADGCYWARQPITIVSESPRRSQPTREIVPSAAHLQIGNDCTACCSCDDYVAAARRLNELRDDYASIGATLIDVSDQYHENRTRWLAQQECRGRQTLQLALQPQSCPSMDVVARFCNQSSECRKNVVLILDFQAVPAILPENSLTNLNCADPPHAIPVYGGSPLVEVGCRRTFITTSSPKRTLRYTLQGKWPQFRAVFEGVNPYDSVEVRFRLEFPNLGLGISEELEEVPYLVIAQATALEGGANLCDDDGNKISVKQSASLECPSDTLEAC